MMRPLVGRGVLRSLAVSKRREDRRTIEKQQPILGFAVKAAHDVVTCEEFAARHDIFEDTATATGAQCDVAVASGGRAGGMAGEWHERAWTAERRPRRRTRAARHARAATRTVA